MAQTRSGASSSPVAVPHLRLKSEVLAPEPEPIVPPSASQGRLKGVLGVLLGIAVLGGGGYFAWQKFGPKPAAPAPASAAAKPTTGTIPPPATETLNAIAHAPANAINKAQDAIAAKRASEQARVDAAILGEDAPGRKAPPPPATATATAKKELAPGLSATTQVEAASNASPEFRSFVANVKVSGVFQGTPARAVINGRLTRVGETVDSRLGVVFDGVDSAQRNLLFKDRSGATVARRY